MTNAHTTLLASLALCLFGATASADDIIPVDSVTHAGRYDLATGTFHPVGSQPGYEASGSSVLFNNTASIPSFTTGSGAIVTDHFMDWGTTDFGGGGATITDIRIGYATNVTAATGLVTLRIRLYQGATGFGTQGTVVGDYVIPGLPNSASGNFEGYTVDVTLPAAISLSEGAFGWSYNSDSAGAATGTGPLLVGPPNEAGVINAYDRYLESNNSYLNTFSFAAPTVGSYVMRLVGRLDSPPVSAYTKFGPVQKIVKLDGDGPGTPGSANTVTITSTVPGKPTYFTAGFTTSNLLVPSLGIRLYCFPWVAEFPAGVPNPANGKLAIPFTIPLDVPPGSVIHMQAFGQNLAGSYVNFSKGLTLTVQ